MPLLFSDENWRAQELEAKIDIKEMSAELRREEMKLNIQEHLAVTNHDKLRRGQLALGLAEIEAKYKGNQSEQKVAAATHRREMEHIMSSARLGKAASEKEAKAEGLRVQEEKAVEKHRAEIEAKLQRAADVRKQKEERKVESIRADTNAKLQRAADARKQEEEQSMGWGDQINAKLMTAEERRDNIFTEKQAALLKSASEKERFIADKLKEEEGDLKMKQNAIQAKLHAAEAKRDDLLATKVQTAKDNWEAKQGQVKTSWLSSLKESKETEKLSEKRLKEASERKNKMIAEMVDEVQDINKSKIHKVEALTKARELEEKMSLLELEKRLAVAAEGKKQHLDAKVASASKKRVLTPRSSPRTSPASLEERINSANNRRELFIQSKVEKARKSGSPKRCVD